MVKGTNTASGRRAWYITSPIHEPDLAIAEVEALARSESQSEVDKELVRSAKRIVSQTVANFMDVYHFLRRQQARSSSGRRNTLTEESSSHPGRGFTKGE